MVFQRNGKQVYSYKLVSRFVEKPNYKHALEMFEDGNFLWNSGIFMFRPCDLLEEFEKYEKSMLDHVIKAVEKGVPDLGFLRLEASSLRKPRSGTPFSTALIT